MAPALSTKDLIAALHKIGGKAEIVNGEVVLMAPTVDEPGSVSLEATVSLRNYAKQHGGRAYGDNVAFLANLAHRKPFSPDASYYTGPRAKMKFLPQPPVLAIEVRSEGDYGSLAEERMAVRRADYFAADTKVVCDVDLLGEDTVRVYRADQPEAPTIFKRGEIAEAEPAAPGRTMPVNDFFE